MLPDFIYYKTFPAFRAFCAKLFEADRAKARPLPRLMINKFMADLLGVCLRKLLVKRTGGCYERTTT